MGGGVGKGGRGGSRAVFCCGLGRGRCSDGCEGVNGKRQSERHLSFCKEKNLKRGGSG